MLDIRVLRLYKPVYYDTTGEQDNVVTLMREEGIDETQYRYVREKLARFGLLERKNDLIREKNLELLQSTVMDLIKQQTSRKPKTVKPPKLGKTSSSTTYRITPMGLKYLTMLEEPPSDQLAD